ncbi:glycosyltransferase [Arthrobacter sp. L77]|uniref:glycosyltransferase n=1 Tax=Arthrobacter sp. L77 TaxID=1496689 RepID=UPI0012E05F58|nr:glycosyltransferase [Arthrobacter sp. L77]
MQLVYQGFHSRSDSPVAEANAAIEQASITAGEKPILIGYTPVGRMNPYQALLYREVGDHGFAVAPIVKSWDFAKLSQVRSKASLIVVHIHWTSFVLNSITSYQTAKKKIQDFKTDIERVISQGGKIVWTLHNVIPHNSRFVDLEIEVQQYIADKASVIHVLSEASVEVMSDFISFDRSKILHVPHPNYKSTYEDYVNRDQARTTLGLSSDDKVYVLLGALKAYKGLGTLLAAFESLCARDPSVPRKLLVGGMPDDDPEVASFVEACKKSANVLIEAKKIPANYVQYYMRAADIGLAPYSRMLNSGAILLYQTFELPVVTSNVSAIWENLDEDIAEMAVDDSVAALESALQRADRFIGSDTSWRIRAHTEQYDSSDLSREFARELRSMLDA